MVAFAWAAAGLFVVSLSCCAWFYLVWLGHPVDVAPTDIAANVTVDVALFSIFALHHSLFARTGIKALVRRLVPAPLERAVYVAVASLLLIGVCGLWRPVPGTAWQVPGLGAWLLRAVQLGGLALMLRSAVRIDIWDLSGISQARTAPPEPSVLEAGGPYRWVRHPIYLGWGLVAFGDPDMTNGRLLFATASVLYLVVGIVLEERGLISEFGDAYRDYQRRVRWRLLQGLW